MGGCYFPLFKKFSIGANCRVQLTVGEGLETESIDIDGIIARSDGEGVGVRFVNVTSESENVLARIIAREGTSRKTT